MPGRKIRTVTDGVDKNITQYFDNPAKRIKNSRAIRKSLNLK